MKNLFAIPRLSFPETFTILITVVVCLVGFANAEVYSNHRKRNPNQREKENFLLQKSSFRESVPYSHEKSKISTESEQTKFASLRDLPESPFDKLFKSNSDYFAESEGTDSEKENDGYGYDDDEYYHFSFKRNDDPQGSSESVKSEKEDAGEANVKETTNTDNAFQKKHKDTDKESETIELLNFKECHTGGKNTNTKPLSEDVHKKQFSLDATSSLKMSDLRENSAIDEKIKERKDSGGGVAANQNLEESKNEAKSDGKDSAKLKDVKLTEESGKREKESNLKDVKEAVAPKSLKETSNASEGKEKNVKVNENDKLEENVNKMESKSKEPAKIVKGEEEMSNYSDKLNEDDLSEIHSRANFVSNDYKESVEAMKTAGGDEDEDNSYEVGEVDKSNDLDNSQEVKTSPDRFRKQDKVRESYDGERLKAYNRQNMKRSESFRSLPSEASFFRKPSNYDTSSLSRKDIFKKSEFWRESGLRDGKSRHQQNSLQQKTDSEQNGQELQDSVAQVIPMDQMQNQVAQNSVFDSPIKNSFGLNFAEIESENGDFRKGCIKPLKRLKAFGEKSKTLFPESLSTDALVKSGQNTLETYVKEPREGKNRRSSERGSERKGKIQNKYSNNKRNVQDNPEAQSKKSEVHPREFKQEDSSIKNSKSGSKLSDGKNQEEQKASGRLRRKSPQKFEYEIKVINQNKEDNRGMDQLSHYGSRRVEKDLKSRVAVDDKYSKKYPYSQVSRDDLIRFNKMSESENYSKNRRRAAIMKRHDKFEDKSEIQPRAAPSGYYGNRVKFGQKSSIRNNDAEHTRFEGNDGVFPYSNAVEKGLGQRAREVKDENFMHDPVKRFDESGTQNKGNSLLLIKKDERTSKTFDEGVLPIPSESDYNSEILAKILAKDNDFVVLKKTENNKFQKISENLPSIRVEATNNQLLKGSTALGEDDDQKNKAKQGLLKKGLQTRSFLFEKDDKKYATNLHGTSSKSNLKKTFDKFRDLAGFFKDNEQEPSDNPVREVKEGRDIVFSEDKLPDPIVISSDPGEKFSAFRTKPQNSIYSISSNFKALDQQEKKNELHNFDGRNTLFASIGKGDTSEYSWEPTLKNIFPEAKSINATIRNGNEVIVLDLNRNQLRREHMLSPLVKQNTKQPYAPFGSTAQLPVVSSQFPGNSQFPMSGQLPSSQLVIPNGSRKIQMVIEDGSYMQQEMANGRTSDKSNKAHDRKGYTVLTTAGNDAKIIIPSSDASNISSLIRNIFDKKDSYKAVSKKSSEGNLENKMSEHYNKFLRDLGELSEDREKDSKSQGFTDKANSYDEGISFNTITQLPREDPLKYLGELLQNIVMNSEPRVSVDKDENLGQVKLEHIEDSRSEYSKEDPDGIKRHWSPADEKGGEGSSVAEVPKEESPAGLRSEMSIPRNEKTSEDELWEELEAASDKIDRLRREGKAKRKRKSVERALSHRERHQSAVQNPLPDWKSEEGGRSDSEASFLDSKQSEGEREENENDSNWVAKLKDEEASKGNSDVKTRFESHLKELIDDLNGNKKQKEQLFVPKQSAWSRKKRKDTRRRKRSTWSDVKNKVSTTAVQNTILKNLAEDNYHSVYFPGIKRRLLSTDIEAEDADSYSDENERDKNVIAEEPQAMCVKNSLNECVDPMIIELLKDDDAEEEKDRERRSLSSDFHSDFKREIDLDESMPNDFQNFLVTSLGAFGSQKREVVKKDEAMGEGKESSPDNYNRAAESGKEAVEDSTLEKREVPSDDSQKLSSQKKYHKSDSFADSNLSPSTKAESAFRSEDQSSLNSKSPELTEEKLPTQIRIQITNANRKEKKSSKPIAEESETASTEVENIPEEEEYLDKTKQNSLRKNNISKLRHSPVSKFSCIEFDDGDYQDNGVKEVPHYTSKRRPKKKKLSSETPSNPTNDMTELDHKARESFPKKAVAETSLIGDHTTQKNAVSNHLPQVETVYNPTQGTNKAQLESSRLTKTNSIGNKNSEKARSSMDSPNLERSKLEDGFLRSYLKDKGDNLKSDKLKDYEYWKSPNSMMGLRQNVNGENPLGLGTDTTPLFSSSKQKFNFQKHTPGALNNYNFHSFPKETISPNNLYDALKLRQDLKNRNAANKDRQNSKILQKTYHMGNLIKQEDKGKSQNSPPRVGGMSTFDFTRNKKFFPQGQDSGDGLEYFSPALQSQTESNTKNKMTLSKYQADPVLDASQDLPSDGFKELDYLDGLEEDYGEDKGIKDNLLANYEQVASNVLKETNKILQTPMYRDVLNYKITDIDDGIGEEDEDAEEDYEENGEDEPEDYTLLTQRAMDSPDGEGRLRSNVQANPLSSFGFLNQKDVGGRFANPNTRAKFISKSPLRDTMGRDSELLCKSSSLLKKVNENSNIFGKNLMQNLYGLGRDNSMPDFNKLSKQEMARVHVHPTMSNKLRKRKLDSHRKVKRSRKPTEIGTRLFFGVKSELSDSDVLSPSPSFEKIKPLRSNNYGLTKEHFLDAEFAGPGNDYENESEEKGKYFNQINFAKNGVSQKVSKTRNADEEGNETEYVKENPEDHGETISDDNILENVIGKYIMRKTVKASTEQASKRSANKEKSRESRSVWHKRRKRWAEYPERVPKTKVVRRRLSSGHLTENNFRKYHKKNFARKRHVPGQESVLQKADFSDRSVFKSENENEREIQRKRSALGFLKKLTNKDRDKKAETPIDSRAAGFEPLSPLGEEKLQGPVNAKEKTMSHEKKLTSDLAHMLPKNGLSEPKLPIMSVGCISKEPIVDKKKSKVTLSEGAIQRMQGPWKIELNDKCDSQISEHPLTDLQKGFNKLVDMKLLPSGEELKGLKAFLVIGRSPTLLTIEEPVLPAPGSHLRESSVDRMKSGYGEAEKAQNEKAEEANRALHETNSFPEGGSSQSIQGLQRNSKISFVITDDQFKTTPFLSKGKLVKRKSAFPPSNNAKIIRDNRHVNEETSEYLGQQVVNAILSHVSANPRFKEVIAPGLAPRTPTYKQENFDKDSTLQKADCSDQLQYFLQRFMYDLEKLAERRVKKRTCTQIDKQAKQFLEFLLAVPTESGKSKCPKEDMCPIPGVLPTPSYDIIEQTTRIYNVSPPECTTESRIKTPNPLEYLLHTTKAPFPECPEDFTQIPTTERRIRPMTTTTTATTTTTTTTTTECPPEYRYQQTPRTKAPQETSYRDLKAEIDSLRKKCCLLLKLIVDYQNLSKLEKEILDSKYHSIMLQLDRINKEIKAAKNFPEDCKENRTVANEDYLCCGCKIEQIQQPKNFTHEFEINCFQTTESTKSTCGRNKKPKQCQTKKLPKLYFEEMKNPAEADVSTTTCIPVFERVSVGKISELRKESKGQPHKAFEVAPPTTLAPNSFDLLLISNTTTAPDFSKHTKTSTCEPTIRIPICKAKALPTQGDSQPANSISAVNSGSNVHTQSDGQQEAGKGREKLASHLPRRRKKRSIRKRESEFKKSESSRKRSEESHEEEYNEWSPVPAARRILNRLESGYEFDDLWFRKPKITKKWRRREKKPD